MDITIKNMTKTYPARKNQLNDYTAVSNMNITIPSGKLVGLLGPSGCGKSTTLFVISGLLDPTNGEIYFGTENVTSLPAEKRGIGLVFQNYALYPHMTVFDNIKFPLTNMKMSKTEAAIKVKEIAKLVQIEDLLERKPSELSGGQQQRVAIARALVKKPNVLLLDEPLSNLDARLRLQTREELRRIQKETGITTIFVTHDQEEAMSICDEMIVMKQGIIMQVGVPQDIYDNPKNLFVATFLGTPPISLFNAYVKSGKLYIGSDYIFDVNVADMEVVAAIRPEGFILDTNGTFNIDILNVEVMGRDKSIVAANENAKNQNFRIIIDSSENMLEKSKASFNIKRNKLFLFDKESEQRIYFD